MKLTKKSLRILALGLLPCILICLLGGWMILKKTGVLSPGRLSAVNENGETLGGYISHAEFEQECGHCHAPVHCVTDTRCQDCHLDVARQRAEAEGIHGSLPTENSPISAWPTTSETTKMSLSIVNPATSKAATSPAPWIV